MRLLSSCPHDTITPPPHARLNFTKFSLRKLSTECLFYLKIGTPGASANRAIPKLVWPPQFGRVTSPRRPHWPAVSARSASEPCHSRKLFCGRSLFTDAPSLSSLLFITLATPHYSHYGSLLSLRLTSHYAHHGRTRRRMCWGQSPPHARHRLVGTVPSSDGGQSPQPGGISPVLGSAAHHGDSPAHPWGQSPPHARHRLVGTVPSSDGGGTVPSARRRFPCFSPTFHVRPKFQLFSR